MIKNAEFSNDGTPRFVLTRIWDDTKKVAMCIGLNPSTANGEKDDATIQRLTASLKALGYGGLKMVNLYTVISSKPSVLKTQDHSSESDLRWLFTTAFSCQEIIFCWGNFKEAASRALAVQYVFPNALCFGRNKNGSPWHPLAMMYAGIKAVDAKLERYGRTTV